MSRTTIGCIGVLVTAALVLTACEEEQEEEVDTGPLLGLLELPVSLRNSAPPPSNFHKIEVSPQALRVNGQDLMTLTSGKVAEADISGTEIPKLTALLKTPVKGVVSLEIHAQVPFWTTSLILGSASKAGISNVSFHVRKPTGGTDDGWLEIKGFAVAPESPEDAEVSFANVQKRAWKDFTDVWEDVYQSCRTAMSGNCAYKPERIAQGGDLKMVLLAVGHGVNVNFYRTGVTEEEDAEAAKESEKKAPKKVRLLDGIANTDLVADVEQAPPATVALFQFRANEALRAPSPVAATIQPLCGSNACGVVVKAERRTMTVRVLSLIGAAFPDGTAAPTIGFEVPAK